MMMRMRNKGALYLVFTGLFCYIMFQTSFLSNVGRRLTVSGTLVPPNQSEDNADISDVDAISALANTSIVTPTDINAPLIFIGGMPRSGTTLVRVMLESHSQVRCGSETHVIPSLLERRLEWKKKFVLREAGITDALLDSAMASFIYAIIARHGRPAKRLCNKDPFCLRHIRYLAGLFPNSKFVLMIRDGRATTHSIVQRQMLHDDGCDTGDYRGCLRRWNEIVAEMYAECKLVGTERCRCVKYEDLVLRPEKEMRALLEFLGLEWEDAVLHHEDYVGKRIFVSRISWSTGQVVEPINTDGLTSWVGKLPADVVRDAADIAPMLAKLGYDPRDATPVYGTPDELVVRNTLKVHENKTYYASLFKSILTTALRL